MNRNWLVASLISAAALSFAVVAPAADDKQQGSELAGWSSDFSSDKEALRSKGKNPYFSLEPGYQLVLEGGGERLVISVLDETKMVDGVETRVVEERETKNDKLVEVSRNFFAISPRTNNVYYFGEEVDDYKDGKIVGHPGAWLSGKQGARFGLMMPGFPLVKARFYNEVAPKVAMDRAEIVGVNITYKAPAGEFKNCLKIEETTPLEPDVTEHKHYAPGIGLIQDGSLKLVKYGIATAVASANKEAESEDEEEEIKFADAPAAVRKTFRREAGGTEIKELVKETEDGETTYEAEVAIDGQEYEILVAADGTLVKKVLVDEDEETPIKFSEAPAAVRKTLQREAGGAKFETVDTFSREGRTLYEVDAKLDGKNYQIIVTAEGLLLSKELDEGEEAEEPAPTKLPDVVSKTFNANFPKAKIHKVDVEEEDGVTVYDIEFQDGDAEKETDITADGVMLEFTIVIEAKDVPKAAMQPIKKAAEGAQMTRIERIEISYETKDGKVNKLPKPITHYAVELTKGDKTAEIVVKPDGTVIESPEW